MARTLVGVYDSSSAAQQVRDELLRQGFDDDEVNVRYADEGAAGTQRSETDEDTGGILGFFRSLFGSDDDDTYVNRYNEAVSGARAVVSVHTDSEESVEAAQSIMNRYDPIDIDVDIQSPSAMGASGAAAGNPRAPGTLHTVSGTPVGGGDRDVERTIPVVEEDLQVGKRVIMRGAVRVFTRIEERPVEESVRLREEHAHVERTAVDRPATEADFQSMQEIEIRETAEEPVVAKQARVVEEVRVGKDVSERTETVRDTVRHTDVRVEQTGSEDLAGNRDWDSDYRTHWQSNLAGAGGRYEDYAPAYRYGATLRGDQRYSGRDWAQVEPDVRRDWEAREPGTWEKIKDSVRYGWEKMTR